MAQVAVSAVLYGEYGELLKQMNTVLFEMNWNKKLK